jgi:predicted lipoprotein with Yx(FWY)xxD motif
MHTRWYAVASFSTALLVAGCGSSSKTTAGGGSAGTTPPASSHASAVSNVSQSGTAGAAGLTLRTSEYGKVVFDANHRALYMFGIDHRATSACYGVCASAWPPLLTKGAPSVGAGLNAKLLATTTRRDGSVQVTYDGHPLYYYSGDAPGKIRCQAQNMHGGFWYVVNADGSPNMSKGHGMTMTGHAAMKHHSRMKSRGAM